MLPKHLVIVLVIVLSFIGCKKDVEQTFDIQMITFLNTRELMLKGKIADSTVLWRYATDEFQSGGGLVPAGGNDQQNKYSVCWLTSNRDLTTRFEINSPVFNTSTDDFWVNVASVGQKVVGGSLNVYRLRLTLNNKIYSTNGDQSNSVLEILKMVKERDQFGRDLTLVWLKTNCNFYDENGIFRFKLQNGYSIVGFYTGL